MIYKVKKALLLVILFAVSGVVLTACQKELTVESAELARANQFGQLENVGTTFAPTDGNFHLRVKLANVEETVILRAVWHVVAVPVSPPMQLGEAEFKVEPPNTKANFIFGIEQTWPQGKYKVELYINNELERTIEFKVQ